MLPTPITFDGGVFLVHNDTGEIKQNYDGSPDLLHEEMGQNPDEEKSPAARSVHAFSPRGRFDVLAMQVQSSTGHTNTHAKGKKKQCAANGSGYGRMSRGKKRKRNGQPNWLCSCIYVYNINAKRDEMSRHDPPKPVRGHWPTQCNNSSGS
jgi:hypothetical protein